MPIYYRSDTRPPEEIFNHGFTPRESHGEDWWLKAIGAEEFKDATGVSNEHFDADKDACICMTTRFESAGLFPITKSSNPLQFFKSNTDDDIYTYIYAIALPPATKIQYSPERPIYLLSEFPKQEQLSTDYKNSYIFIKQDPKIVFFYINQDGKADMVTDLSSVATEFEIGFYEKIQAVREDKPIQETLEPDDVAIFLNIIESRTAYKRGQVELIKEENTPTHMENLVIDLHSFQSMQMGNIVRHHLKVGESFNNYELGPIGVLYGYEAIAHQVSPQSIIGAVKIRREKLVDFARKNMQEACTMFGNRCAENLYTQPQLRVFHVEGDILINPNFQSRRNLSNDNNNNNSNYDDYNAEREEAIEKFKEAKQKGEQPTSDIGFGLGGKSY